MKRIFVFGSNLSGIHGAGSAKEALRNHGAVWGRGVGCYGNSYAIPTKDRIWKVLPLAEIRKYVVEFIEFAKTHPDWVFDVVRIGCGLAGYTDKEIAPLFFNCPENCNLPEGWR